MRTRQNQVNAVFLKQIFLELRIFLIDARFETTAIFINFILPSAVLIIAILTAPKKNITDMASNLVIFQFVTYICLTTVMNLVVSYLVQTREEGVLLTHAHIFSSPKPYIFGLIIGQSLVGTIESVLLSILGMSLTQHFHWSIIVAVIIGVPVVIFILSFFLLPLALWRGTANNSTAVIAVVLLVFFNLPGKAPHPAFTFLLQLNPVHFSENTLSLLLSPRNMNILPTLLANCTVVLLSVLAGIISLRHFPIRPFLKRA